MAAKKRGNIQGNMRRAPSIAHQHAEWRSLIEVSGPFLSMEVLTRAFPQGLDKPADESDVRARVKAALDEWEDHRGERGIHDAWVRLVLKEVLELGDEVLLRGQAVPTSLVLTVAEQGETIRPDIVIANPSGTPDAGKPRLLISVTTPGQNLDGPVPGHRWKASPATRMMELLHATDVRLGLVTDGEQWMLVHAPRQDTSTFASFYATLWGEEPLTFRAFRALLGSRRFFGVRAGGDHGETLEDLFAQSEKNQAEVTDQLGYQVRRAVEVLIQAIDRIDRDRNRQLLRGSDEKRLYESAVTVMMRLVFLLAAEEQGMLLLGHPLYDQHYAVGTLVAQLRAEADRHGEEILERRRDAWSRLLATFRAVHGGVQHDDLRLPAYGGSLFDPDRFPFLEGRRDGTRWRSDAADPLPIHNRTVLHLLDAIQFLEIKVPGGPPERQRLSFRALGVEQIGHVYEGLLDHTAVRAAGPVLGLAGTKDKEPEVPLEEIERTKKKGVDELLAMLHERTGKSESALKKSIAYEIPKGDQKLLVACENKRALYNRIVPYAGLLREDTSAHPVVYDEGSVYVTEGAERRATGTHYTPPSLTEPIVRYTLEPLVYEGPAERKPKEAWKLKSAKDILALRVCDMAMGSGAFLVQACRYLSQRLVEAWEDVEKSSGGRVVVTPEGALSTGDPTERPIPTDAMERLTIARRFVVDRCLYGVDKNPMAVEMGKLSLWLTTLQKAKPFTFVDHALRCGDSLLGLTRPEQLEYFHLDPKKGETELRLGTNLVATALKTALAKRRELESFPVESVRDAEAKARLLGEAENAVDELRVVGDLLIGGALRAAGNKKELETELGDVGLRVSSALQARPEKRATELTALRQSAAEGLRRDETGTSERRPFHWVLEFPEVFAAGGEPGFDAIVGNPPFMGGQKMTGELGRDYREHLVEHLGGEQRGSADLCAYFFLRAGRAVRPEGSFGLIATNTIGQGDTREVGLDQLIRDGFVLSRAIASRPWPGSANLEVAQVWGRRGSWRGPFVLDEEESLGITSGLTAPNRVEGRPFQLKANAGKSFQGSIVLGMGFVLEPDEAAALIKNERSNENVLFPYLNGEDLNSRPDQSASRWVINFRDWPLDRKSANRGYEGPVAVDFPDCLAIVREKVKPERDQNNRAARRERWWQYAERAHGLYEAIDGLERVLVKALVSNTWAWAMVPTTHVFMHKLVVCPLGTTHFAVLQSAAHESWARHYGSSMRTDLNYSPSDCFGTFPFPVSVKALDRIGERYHAHRQSIMRSTDLGLTKTYNRFHDRDETDAAIAKLRHLHVDMDLAVTAAYGWDDVKLTHGFHETKQGLRFTISDKARREVLARLLELNHARHVEELASGLHARSATSKGPSKGRPGGAEGQGSLF